MPESTSSISAAKKYLFAFGGCIAVAIVAVALLAGANTAETPNTDPAGSFSAGVELKKLTAEDARALDHEFGKFSYTWPPTGTEPMVPPIEVTQLPGDLHKMVVKTKKSVFFRTLLPLVVAENDRIESQREWIISRFEQGPVDLSTPEGKALARIAKKYRVKGDLNDEATREKLLVKVDTIPVGLVLAQAAKESGWGTSRFALQGNSLFGEWTWSKGGGLTPEKRDEGARHSVRAFPDLRASVRSYMHNLNMGFAYGKLRAMRAEMRRNGEHLDSVKLAGGLVRYSQRGEAYVREIRQMITYNGLDRLTPVKFALDEKASLIGG